MLLRAGRVTLFHFLPSPSTPVRRLGRLASMSATFEQNSLEAVANRPKLFKDMQIDVLSAAHEADNDKARHIVSRSFTCMSFNAFASRSKPTYPSNS